MQIDNKLIKILKLLINKIYFKISVFFNFLNHFESNFYSKFIKINKAKSNLKIIILESVWFNDPPLEYLIVVVDTIDEVLFIGEIVLNVGHKGQIEQEFCLTNRLTFKGATLSIINSSPIFFN